MTLFNFIPTVLEAKDSVWPGQPSTYNYYNLVKGNTYSYYEDPSLIAGVSLQVNEFSLMQTRTVKSFFGMAAQIGGFSRLAHVLFVLLLFFTRTWGGEKYLVAEMYKMLLSRETFEARRSQNEPRPVNTT